MNNEFDFLAYNNGKLPSVWFDLDPLIESARKEGLIHDMSCANSLIGNLLGLRPAGKPGNFLTVWNDVEHGMNCGKLACRELREPMHLSKYANLSAREFTDLKKKTSERFGWDRASEVIVGETQDRLDILADGGQGAEVVSKLSENLKRIKIAAVANIDVPLNTYELLRFHTSTYYHEVGKELLNPEQFKGFNTAVQELEEKRDGLRQQAEQWFDSLYERAS